MGMMLLRVEVNFYTSNFLLFGRKCVLCVNVECVLRVYACDIDVCVVIIV